LLRRWVLLGFGLALRCSSGLLLAAEHHPVPFSVEQQPHLRRGFGPNPDWLDIRNPVMEVQICSMEVPGLCPGSRLFCP
jgi:hypothetical protein